jgi:hypothetical protein
MVLTIPSDYDFGPGRRKQIDSKVDVDVPYELLLPQETERVEYGVDARTVPVVVPG